MTHSHNPRAPLRPAGFSAWICALAILAWAVFRILDQWVVW